MAVNSWIGGNVTGTLSGSANFFGIANINSFSSTTETDVRSKYPAGTASMLSVFIGSVSGTPTMTARFRKNAANGNQTVTSSAGGTGWQQDTTHSDTTVDGDQVAGALQPSGASVTFNGALSIQFAHATDGVQLYQTNAAVNLSSGNNGNESPFGGVMAFDLATVNRRAQLQTATTLSHLTVVVTNQLSAGTIVFITRKNGFNANQTVSFASGVNGDAEDTTHTDSFASGDQGSFSYSGITTNFTAARSCKVRANNSGGLASDTVSSDETGANSSTYTTYFVTPNGGAQDQKNATETLAQTKAPYGLSTANLRMHIRNGTTNQTLTLNTRVNGVSGNAAAALTAGSSGWAVDSTHSDIFTAGDLGSIRFTTTSTTGTYQLLGTGWTLGAASSTATGAALMAFGGIKFVGAGSAAQVSHGVMAFGGIKFAGAGSVLLPSGAAVMHFSGIKLKAFGADTGTSPSPSNPVVDDNSNLSKLQPLTYNVQVTDKNGFPTPEFQRKWQKQFDVIKAQFAINQTIVPQSYIDAAINNSLNVALAGIAAALATAEAYTDSRLLPNATVAALPASPAHGTRGYVTDATGPTFGNAVVGGGTVETPVYFDGAWKVG